MGGLSGSVDVGKKVSFAADHRAMKGSVSHGLDTTNNGERTGSHRELAFATGRYSGSRFAVAVSLLAVHMAVRGREPEGAKHLARRHDDLDRADVLTPAYPRCVRPCLTALFSGNGRCAPYGKHHHRAVSRCQQSQPCGVEVPVLRS